MVGQCAAPIIAQLAKANSVIRHQQEWMTRHAHAAEQAESFPALIAMGLSSLGQQIAGLARFNAASAPLALASPAGRDAATAEPVLKQPVTSPERKHVNRENKADKVAQRQAEALQGRISSVSGAGQQRQTAAEAAGRMSDGIQIVYPGHAGEAQWVQWNGRCDLHDP